MPREQFSVALSAPSAPGLSVAASFDVCPECWVLVPTTMFSLHEVTHNTPPTRPGSDADLLQLALGLLADMVDPDDCNYDHHGGCQAHGFLSLEPPEKCPHQIAKDLLDQEGIDWR
jgi:hypothetical protein